MSDIRYARIVSTGTAWTEVGGMVMIEDGAQFVGKVEEIYEDHKAVLIRWGGRCGWFWRDGDGWAEYGYLP